MGAVDELPSEEQLPKPQNVSSVAPWLSQIETWLGNGAQPTAIYDRLKRECPDFTGSISAGKRACLSQRKALGVRAEDVAIPVQTEPGAVAQVDFGYIGEAIRPKSAGAAQAVRLRDGAGALAASVL